MESLTTFAADFVDDTNTLSSLNFINQESGDHVSAVPNISSFASFSASEEARSKRRREATSNTFITEGTAKREKCACYKCGQDTCRGSSRKVLCNNPCRDCNQVNCEGRSTVQPDLPCGDGTWSLSS
jgi:hypothetical protein